MYIFTTYSECTFRQINAEMSWATIGADVEVFDDDYKLKRNEWGTPLISSLFAHAEDAAVNDTVAYVNSDIILGRDFAKAIQALEIKFNFFLMVGRRFNWNNPRPLTMRDFHEGYGSLVTEVMGDGKLFNAATDYFAFPKYTFEYRDWPDFAIGRYFWDPWIMWRALQMGVPVVDVTEAVFAIHQNHPPNHRSWDVEGKINEHLAKEVIDARIDLDSVKLYMDDNLKVRER